MSAYYSDEIRRDGFISTYGRFLAEPGRMDRIEGSQLRSMFLPKLSREAQKALRDERHFVPSQLKHYGVPFEEREFRGNGTALMTALLQAGKCDQVPDHIVKLQEQMLAEWLSGRTDEQLASEPDWVMQKYFLSAGQPDHTKPTTIVGTSLPRSSEYLFGQMIEAASKVTGLDHVKAIGPRTQVIFMGWDRAAVERAANQHPAADAKRLRGEKDKLQKPRESRQKRRERMHTDYLNSRGQQTRGSTPVGSYIVDCEALEKGWRGQAGNLSLDIHQTDTPGVFKADSDFGILEGVMIICSDESALDEYCARANGDDESHWGDEEETDDEGTDDEASIPATEDLKLGAKRKPPLLNP